MKITVNIDPDQMDTWIEEDLRRCYVDARVHWHNEPDNDRLCEALLTVLDHYMWQSDFEAWYESIKEL